HCRHFPLKAAFRVIDNTNVGHRCRSGNQRDADSPVGARPANMNTRGWLISRYGSFSAESVEGPYSLRVAFAHSPVSDQPSRRPSLRATVTRSAAAFRGTTEPTSIP